MRAVPRDCWLLLGCWRVGGAGAEAALRDGRRGQRFLGIQTIRLWPGDAPEAKGKACEDIPTLTILEPQQGPRQRLSGGDFSGRLVCRPGGQSRRTAGGRLVHGARLSRLHPELPAHLATATCCRFRCSTRGAPSRRCGRGRADYHIDPNRIVVIGFSAGGHLAALAATQFVPGNPDAEDPIERVSSRPDYLVLGYPWIGAISSDTSHLSYCKLFNVMDRCEALRAAYSPDLFVTKDTPPTFWYHTFNDQTVPVEQGLRFYEALVKAGVPAEAHIFANGPWQRASAATMRLWTSGRVCWRPGCAAQGLLNPKAVSRPRRPRESAKDAAINWKVRMIEIIFRRIHFHAISRKVAVLSVRCPDLCFLCHSVAPRAGDSGPIRAAAGDSSGLKRTRTPRRKPRPSRRRSRRQRITN